MTSRTKHSTRYRCRRCEAKKCKRCSHRFRWRNTRKTEPKCPCCGTTTRLYNEERIRRAEMAKKDICRCKQYPFPHQKGTMTMCDYSPDRVAGIDPTQEEIDDYYGCLATPRSGVG